jgi:threonine dehydrogenase-like Zn-dependent dehydrogenase
MDRSIAAIALASDGMVVTRKRRDCDQGPALEMQEWSQAENAESRCWAGQGQRQVVRGCGKSPKFTWLIYNTEIIYGSCFCGGQACFRSLKVNGRLVTCGVTAGHRVDLHLGQVFSRALQIMGVGRGSPQDMRELLRLLALGRVRPVIHARFPLQEAVAAHRLLESSQFFGKVVLQIA